MKQNKWTALFPSFGLVLLILDAKCALEGAREGISLCTMTVIPSLFPYFVLTAMLTGCIGPTKVLAPLGKMCRIPPGTEHLLLLSLLGGYPTGARSIRQAYENRQISLGQAKRMMGFCNHPGPAFLFGICGGLFGGVWKAFVLWGAMILSVLFTAMLLPGKQDKRISPHSPAPVSFPQAVQQALRSTASVCGWVVLFRIILRLLARWCFWLPGDLWQILVAGALEITNGCTMLPGIGQEGLRFFLCGIILCMGGLCVAMQVLSASGPVGFGLYILGKLLQTAICGAVLCLMQPVCFPAVQRWGCWLPGTLICTMMAAGVYFLTKSKNNSSKPAANVV